MPQFCQTACCRKCGLIKNVNYSNMSNKKIIHDRFRGLAGFLCGYLSVERSKSENEDWKQDLASILRRYADIDNPLILTDCKKCKTTVELKWIEYEEEDNSGGYYYCPKCNTNYFDNKGNDPYTEMDEHEEMQEENRIEKEIERKLERASNCTCGAYQIIGMVEPIQTADCCCGAD